MYRKQKSLSHFAHIGTKFLLDYWWTASKWMGEHCKKINLQPVS